MKPRAWATVIAFAFAGPVVPQDDAAVRKELADVRERIEAIQVRLVQERAAESDAATQLAQREKRIGEVTRRVATLAGEIRQAETDLGELEKRRRELRASLARERDELSRAARLVWLAGRRSDMQQFLEAGTPDRLGRGLVYQSYFSRAGRARVSRFAEALTDAVDVTRRLERRRAQASVLQGRHREELQVLEQERVERKKILEAAARAAAGSSGQLADLTQDAERLERLLAELRRALADIPEDPDRDASFGSRRGRLTWPARGEVAARFGSRRASGVRWNGLLIAAPMGTPIRAVASGRVAFADWLRGYGLLTILDHGGGYLTLYGFNETLYKEAGEWVAGGAPLGTVGNSGGRPQPGLYFEIRHQGKPVNPSGWLSKTQ